MLDKSDNRCFVRQDKMLTRLFSFVLVLSIAVSGCKDNSQDGRQLPQQPEKNSAVTTSRKINAHIVLADRKGYVCLPFEELGLEDNAKVASVLSSCECVRPQVIRYRDANRGVSNAILLEYVEELKSQTSKVDAFDDSFMPVRLAILVTIELSDGTVVEFTLNVLHTVALESSI